MRVCVFWWPLCWLPAFSAAVCWASLCSGSASARYVDIFPSELHLWTNKLYSCSLGHCIGYVDCAGDNIAGHCFTLCIGRLQQQDQGQWWILILLLCAAGCRPLLSRLYRALSAGALATWDWLHHVLRCHHTQIVSSSGGFPYTQSASLGAARCGSAQVSGHHGLCCGLLYGRIHRLLTGSAREGATGHAAHAHHEHMSSTQMGTGHADQRDAHPVLWPPFGHCQSQCQHAVSREFCILILKLPKRSKDRLQERQFLVTTLTLEFLVSSSFYFLRFVYLPQMSPSAILLALFVRSQLTNSFALGLIFVPKLWYQHKQVTKRSTRSVSLFISALWFLYIQLVHFMLKVFIYC